MGGSSRSRWSPAARQARPRASPSFADAGGFCWSRRRPRCVGRGRARQAMLAAAPPQRRRVPERAPRSVPRAVAHAAGAAARASPSRGSTTPPRGSSPPDVLIARYEAIAGLYAAAATIDTTSVRALVGCADWSTPALATRRARRRSSTRRDGACSAGPSTPPSTRASSRAFNRGRRRAIFPAPWSSR